MRLLAPVVLTTQPCMTVICPDQTAEEREKVEAYLAVYTALLQAIDPQAQAWWYHRCAKHN
jgi:hypothetical protein